MSSAKQGTTWLFSALSPQGTPLWDLSVRRPGLVKGWYLAVLSRMHLIND